MSVNLEYLYAHETSTETKVSVFANGVMQVVAYVAVSYDSMSEADAIKNVQTNCVIWSLDDKKPVSWTKSFTSNEYLHDIDYGNSTVQKSSPLDLTPTKGTQLRVPIYFTVPRGAYSRYKWIAKMGKNQTSEDEPLEISGTQFSADPDQFIFEDMDSYDQGHAHLRCLRYKSGAFGPHSPLKLVKLVEKMGINLEGTAWMIFVRSSNSHKSAFFFEYGTKTASIAAQNGYYYESGSYTTRLDPDIFFPMTIDQSILTSEHGYPWDDCEGMDLTEAWSLGIPIVRIDEKKLNILYDKIYDFDIKGQGIKVEDNFGNQMSLDIDWDKGGDWYANWAVSKVVLLNA